MTNDWEHLLEIKKLADMFPNCGQLKKALSEFYKERISILTKKPTDVFPLIGILVDIMFNNPNYLPQCALIIGQLLTFEKNKKATDTLANIFKKYETKPNTDYLVIWLERLILKFGDVAFEEPMPELVRKIKDPLNNQLFSTDWLKEDYKEKFYEGSIINEDKQEKMSREIFETEMDDFYEYPF